MDPVKARRYDASRRRAQAETTRRAVMDAARHRFLADGYAVTTVASIAGDAGTSPDTVYKTFGGKSGLFRAVCDEALTGSGGLPAEQRSDALQAAESDPVAILRGLGRLTAEVAPRIAPLLLVLATVAEGDPALRRLQQELEDARLTRMTHVAGTLVSKMPRTGRGSVAEIADILWTYSSPELYRLLVVGRGWPAQRYGAFVGDALVAALLGPTTPPTPRRAVGGREVRPRSVR